MEIEKELFQGYSADRKRLKVYGFKQEGKSLFLQKTISEGFSAQLLVDENGELKGRVIEDDLNEEYINIRNDDLYGAFVSELRNSYSELLLEVREKCFRKEDFLYPQSRRIAAYLKKEFGDKYSFTHKDHPDHAVFADHRNQRNYALIMPLSGKKFKRQEKIVEVLCLRSDQSSIASLTAEDGFGEAYYLNKNEWLSIVLDDTFEDELLYSLIDYSRRMIENSDAWLVPANVEYYDVIHCFDERSSMLWKQAAPIHIGDIVYLYVGKPYSAILYKCVVEETDIPYDYQDQNIRMRKAMRITLLKRYAPDRYPLSYLNSIGIKMVRATRKISREESEKLG